MNTAYTNHRLAKGEAGLLDCAGCGRKGHGTVAERRRNGGLVHAECIAARDEYRADRADELKALVDAIPRCQVVVREAEGEWPVELCDEILVRGECQRDHS